jgi:hypothetical protein
MPLDTKLVSPLRHNPIATPLPTLPLTISNVIRFDRCLQVPKIIFILEIVASQDLWIWHSFFDMAGSHDDINMLQRSQVFSRLAEDNAPVVHYEINCHGYNTSAII